MLFKTRCTTHKSPVKISLREQFQQWITKTGCKSCNLNLTRVFASERTTNKEVSWLHGSAERQKHKAQHKQGWNLSSKAQSALPAVTTAFLYFKTRVLRITRTLTPSRRLKELLSSLGSNRTLPPTWPALLGSQGVLPEFCSSQLPTGSQRNHTTMHCASREADRKTLLFFISSEHVGGPEGKQKVHKWRWVRETSTSILPCPGSEFSLLTETVFQRGNFSPNKRTFSFFLHLLNWWTRGINRCASVCVF